MSQPRVSRPFVWGALLILLVVPRGFSQQADPSPWSLGLSASLGTETLTQPDNNPVNYEDFGLYPDIGYGPFGVGLDLSFHFQFYQQAGGPFGIYPRAQDWWDSTLSTGQNIDKYLARILYARWGHRGDPLYLQLGLLSSTTLGSGFLVGGYSNGALRPEFRPLGLEVDASGDLVEFPSGGFEGFVGSVSAFDVLGARVYAQPLGFLFPDNGFLKAVQLGVTVAADTNPYGEFPSAPNQVAGSVVTTGLDTRVPLYSDAGFSADATANAALEGTHAGGALGVGGKAFEFLRWGVENRFLGDNFLPDYFDQGYEVDRVDKFMIYNGTTSVPGTLGWEASLGTSLLDDAVTFTVSLSGPWTSQTSVYAQPQFESLAQIKPGILPVDLSAYYIKNGLNTWADLATPVNALVGAKAGYTIGSVTLSLVYDLHYLSDAEVATYGLGPNGNRWVTTSRLETSAKMF